MTCAYCQHAEEEHCKGQVRHQHYKDEMRQVVHSRTRVCHVRHCLQPLCDCVNFQPETRRAWLRMTARRGNGG
jgi:hypothetical protein